MPIPALLKTSIANYAKSLGFDLVGVSPPKIEQKYLDTLDSWLKKGAAADMQYMKDPEKLAARSDLSKVLPGVKSVIVLGVNYYYEQPPLKRGYGRVARYAAGRDYHKVIGKMLKKLVKFLEQIEPDKNHKHKAYVDTGPILERALAEQSGIGQIGKNALVISREFGSWIFLAEVLTTIDLGFSSAPTAAVPGDDSPTPASSYATLPTSSPLHQKPFGLCGQCTKCIQACPTGAIIAPGVIDSRLCISYLTIENRKKIPAHLAKKIKKTRRLFGCDICQEVCPHNEAKQKPVSGDVFASRHPQPLAQLPLKKILAIKSEQKFRINFSSTALMRTKLKGLKRNARAITPALKTARAVKS